MEATRELVSLEIDSALAGVTATAIAMSELAERLDNQLEELSRVCEELGVDHPACRLLTELVQVAESVHDALASFNDVLAGAAAASPNGAHLG